MIDTPDGGETELATLIASASAADAAESIGEGIFQSPGISNSYLVTSDEGDLVVNTGMPWEEHRERFAAVSGNPVHAIVFTQSHADHIGGWEYFTGPRVETIVQQNFDDVREYWSRLGPFYTARSLRLWASVGLPVGFTPPPPPPEPQPTVRFEHDHHVRVGDRSVELYSTPGGETTDSLVVWLPDERTAFTGNLFGPLFGHVPNLYTIRGDKIRSALAFIRSVDRVRELGPEVLITGHGRPIRGAEQIDVALARLRNAVEYIRTATIDGMNEGQDLSALMHEITLPEGLALGEGHGKVSWNVRAVWEEHAGWFRYESTTELYDLPPRAVWAEIADMVGGVGPMLAAAERHVAAGEPLEALHLLDIALSVDRTDEGLRLKREALQHLLDVSGRTNLSETKWLESEMILSTTVTSNPTGAED